MRVHVDVTPAASRDLAELADYLARNAGERVAARWIARLEAAVALLEDMPCAGAESDFLGPGRRRIVVRPYLVVYRILRDDLVRVIRVVDGRRDLPSLFADEPE